MAKISIKGFRAKKVPNAAEHFSTVLRVNSYCISKAKACKGLC